MPAAAAAGVKAGSQVCHCGHGESETLPSLLHHKDASPKKQASSYRKDEYLSSIAMNSEASGGLSMPSPDFTTLGVLNKWHLNHWWEAPSGSTSRGRAASCMLSVQDPLDSPTHSDLTFEGGTVPNFQRDDAMEAAPVNTATISKTSASGGAERACGSSNDQGPSTSIPSRLESLSSMRGGSTEVESKTNQPEAAHSKDRASRWTDENGKMVIQNDVFDAILPSADECTLGK